MPDLIPEPHAGYARRICELIASDYTSLRDRISSESGLSASYATRLVEDPSIVCVAGERGSGKTTVLATAAAQLAADGHVVLPPVRPEYFPTLGSLMPTVVAHLQTSIRTDWLDTTDVDPDASLKLATAIDRTLRQANLILFDVAEGSPLRADERAADRSLVASADSDFIDNWRQLTMQVREMAATRSHAPGQPLIVIPVDDPDLAPGTLRQILLDLRLMTSVDGVVGITCLDLAEARYVLTDAYARSYRTPPSRLLSTRVVEAQIAKALPDDRRVMIRGLDSEQKLRFTALDLPLPPIEQLCDSYAIGPDYGDATIASVFRMPMTGEPSLYAAALPSNPRDLRGLAYRLSDLPVGDDAAAVGAAAMELCRTAIATGLKESGATDEALWPGGFPFEELAPVDGRPACVLRFDNVVFHSILRAQHELPSDKGDTTLVKLLYNRGIDAAFVQRGRTEQGRQRLAPSLGYALLLVREFSHFYDVIHCDVSGPVPSRGGDHRSHFLEATIDDLPTDDRFLNPPAWEAYYDTFLLDDVCAVLIPVATSPHELSDRRLLLEAYFIDFCRNVVSIQTARLPSKDPARVSRAIRRRDELAARRLLDRELKRLFAEIEACLDTLDERTRNDRVRADDFRWWVDVGIVNICHDKLLRPEFIQRLLSHRADVLTRRGRLSVANARLTSALERRIKAVLDEPWVGPLIDVVQQLNPETGMMLSASHLAAIDAVQRGRHRLLGQSALSGGGALVEATPASDAASDFGVAMAALDALEAEVRAAT